MQQRIFFLCAILLTIQLWSLSLRAQDDAAKWEPEIAKLEALDRQETDPENGILFIGSSSIRLWDSIADDMDPYPTIRRGYGGAKFSDLDTFIQRLVVAHQSQAIVIFVANDITGSVNDKSPQEVIEIVDSITAKVREIHPTTPIFFVEITPTRSRWKAWREIRKLNGRLAEFCSDYERVHFISTVSHYLDPETDEPIDEYFTKDQLHQNADGYRVWGAVIKSRLDQVLGFWLQQCVEC